MESRANPNSRLFIPPDPQKKEEVKKEPVPEMRTRGGLEMAGGETVAPTSGLGKSRDAARTLGEKVKASGGKWAEPIKKFNQQQEQNLEHFYDYQIFHPRFLQVIVFLLGLGVIITSLVLTLQFFKSAKPVEPIYNKIEGIKRLGEMHLVKQQYESVIPITKKKVRRGELKRETLQFLLIAPIEVTGYIDFSRLRLSIEKDSLLKIQLPEPKVSKAYLDFSRTEEFLAEGKLKIFGKYLENINHKQAYFDIAGGINEAKERIRTTAVNKHDILKETQYKAETFLRNFVSTLGYRVEFSSISDQAPEAESLPDSQGEGGSAKKENGGLMENLQNLLPSNR